MARAPEKEFFTQAVRVRVDGKLYVGCIDIDALGELQKLWGIDNLVDMQARVENVSFSDMKDLVFVSLLRDQPTITKAESDKIANAMGMNGIMAYVSEVMAAAKPPQAVPSGPTKRARARKPR